MKGFPQEVTGFSSEYFNLFPLAVAQYRESGITHHSGLKCSQFAPLVFLTVSGLQQQQSVSTVKNEFLEFTNISSTFVSFVINGIVVAQL